MVSALNTPLTAKRLKEAGVDDAQAEASTGVLREAREAEISQLATRAGVEPLRTEMKAEFAPIRSEWRSWGGM
jgi:hypothetical protein